MTFCASVTTTEPVCDVAIVFAASSKEASAAHVIAGVDIKSRTTVAI
jgi:hypothetical protein